ncbi:MAG: hypothetical protein SOU51_02010 [Collinsella sp.]|nr:hypothetical protein [Collinsella sp.]
MSKKPLTADEAKQLFSEIDDSGVLDPTRSRDRSRRGTRRPRIDPLSEEDPSGSKVGKAISRTSLLVIVGVLAFVVGMQVVYGINRRLSTANLSENVDRSSVEHALESGVEWGNGFTQFPSDFTVEEADERTGTVEVTVVDTDSRNELELLSNSQIQAAALATNALLNNKIDRVVYNVCALVRKDGSFAHDAFFGFIPAQGSRRAILTFIWTKTPSSSTSYIDWELKIVGMDDKTAEKIQMQVNSLSNLIEDPAVTQNQINEERDEMDRERLLHGPGIFRGPSAKEAGEPQEGSER